VGLLEPDVRHRSADGKALDRLVGRARTAAALAE
jgi:hypothetical protein